MAQNLTRYDVVDAGNGWELKTGGRVIFHFATKSEAIDHARLRTYPRSKDPRKSPG